MKFLFVCFAVIFVLITQSQADSYPKITVESPDGQARFFLNRSDSTMLPFLLKIYTEINEDLLGFYNYNTEKITEIVYIGSKKQFLKFGTRSIPDWSGAYVIPAKRRIILGPPASNKPDHLKQTLAHELSHQYLHDIVQNLIIPRWFDEGLAMYLSNEQIDINEALQLANAITTNRIFYLDQIDSLLDMNRAEAELAYLQSFTLIQYLVSLKDVRGLKMFVNSLSKYNSFRQALGSNYQVDLIDLEFGWFNFLKKRYKWIIMLNFENAIWLILIFLVIIAFIGKKIKNARKLKEWELSELED